MKTFLAFLVGAALAGSGMWLWFQQTARIDAPPRASADSNRGYEDDNVRMSARIDAPPRASAAECIEKYKAGKWERFIANVLRVEPGGQIMRKPNGSEIFVPGDLGKAKDEKFTGYFERAGTHDCRDASGVTNRIQQYYVRGDASSDMSEDWICLTKLKTEMTRCRISGEKFSKEKISELAEIQVRLENEGYSPILLE